MMEPEGGQGKKWERGSLLPRHFVKSAILLATTALAMSALFASLDLVGRALPIFDTGKWGTFGEWAMALLTPLTVVASVAMWMQDREDRESSRAKQIQIDAVRAVGAKESSVRGLRLSFRPGLSGMVGYLNNGCALPATLVHTSCDGELADPCVVEPGGDVMIPGLTAAGEVHVIVQGIRFLVNERGLKWIEG